MRVYGIGVAYKQTHSKPETAFSDRQSWGLAHYVFSARHPASAGAPVWDAATGFVAAGHTGTGVRPLFGLLLLAGRYPVASVYAGHCRGQFFVLLHYGRLSRLAAPTTDGAGHYVFWAGDSGDLRAGLRGVAGCCLRSLCSATDTIIPK